jgi:hypothetical protein
MVGARKSLVGGECVDRHTLEEQLWNERRYWLNYKE